MALLRSKIEGQMCPCRRWKSPGGKTLHIGRKTTPSIHTLEDKTFRVHIAMYGHFLFLKHYSAIQSCNIVFYLLPIVILRT